MEKIEIKFIKWIWKNGKLEENKEIKLQNFYLCEMDIKLTFFYRPQS